MSYIFNPGANTYSSSEEISDNLLNRIIVTQGNLEDTIGGVIDSTKEYFLDGIIDMGLTQITVPTTGISIKGYSFDNSGLTSSSNNYTMFISESAIIGSGNLLGSDYHVSVTGTNSKVYNLYDATGFSAFEFSRVNYNDCTSLGDIHDYRQGLEFGTGRFGGSPSLTLHGTWVGGYRITTSIVRSMSSVTTEPLFKAGTAFLMTSRFLTDINVDLGTLQPFLDFAPANFVNSSTLDLKGCRITRDGIEDASDSNVMPNILKSDLESIWIGNQGIGNTFVGGTMNISTAISTPISVGVYTDLLGTFTTSNLEHFDSPSNGQLRHLGSNPIEYTLHSDIVLDGTANEDIRIKVVIWRDATSVFEDGEIQERILNNLQGARDVGFFSIFSNITLNQNDYVKIQVTNDTASNPVIAELDSKIIIIKR